MLTFLPRLLLTLNDWLNHVNFHCFQKGNLVGYVRCSLLGLGIQQRKDMLTKVTTSIADIIGLFLDVWYIAKIDGKDVTVWPNTLPIPVHTTPVRQQSFNALQVYTPPVRNVAGIAKAQQAPPANVGRQPAVQPEVQLELPPADKPFNELTVVEFWNSYKSLKSYEERVQFCSNKKFPHWFGESSAQCQVCEFSLEIQNTYVVSVL